MTSAARSESRTPEAGAAVTDEVGVADRLSSHLAARPWLLGLVAVPLVGLATLGYGTDIDAAGVRSSGAMIRHGFYVPSRPPGSLVSEGVAAGLDLAGGPFTLNLVSVLAGVAVVVLVARLVRRAGGAHAELAALTVAANAQFLVAGSSLVDFLWALAFVLGGLDAAQRRRPALAGVLWGLAIGTRSSSVVLVGAAIVASLLDSEARRLRRTLIATGVAVAIGALAYVPAWWRVGRSADFLEGSFGAPSTLNLLGRTAVKIVLFVGFPAAAVLVGVAPAALRGIRERVRTPVVAFAVLGAAAMLGVFVRLPWKLGHLLPLLVCGVLVVASSPHVRARWLVALLVAQLAWGFVAVRTVVPDVRDDAGSARLDLAVVAGPLVTDVQCRIDHPLADSAIDPRNKAISSEAFTCANDWAYGSSP